MPTVALCIYLKALHIFPTYLWMLIICLWTCFSMAFDVVITIGFGLSLFVYIYFFSWHLLYVFAYTFSDRQRDQDTCFTISILSSRHVMNVYCSLVWLKCLLCIFLILENVLFGLTCTSKCLLYNLGMFLNTSCFLVYICEYPLLSTTRLQSNNLCY